MFCPKCATNNVDGASFCRGCGANISLVSQALTGQMTQQPVEEVEEEGGRRHRRRRDRGELSLDQSFRNVFMGIGFLVLAIVLSRTIGYGWWFWFLIPAFSMMGTGIAQFIRLKEREKRAALTPPPINRGFQPPPRTPEELRPPVASVTEGTTRHLGVEAPTRQFDPSERK
ncbi:MAG TPA: zinc ribbon domain-containing protein [Pyrinomonadaceae bacterium]|nr:zinc ribbon domain-containing protein [Pyrinomonadaceae bacterium]